METLLKRTVKNSAASSCSYNDLMRLWQSQPYSEETEQTNFQELMQESPALASIFNVGPCVIWILNVRTKRYCFVSDNVSRLLGYPAHAFTKGGISFLKELIHPGDTSHVWNLTKKTWEYFLALPPGKRKGYQFSQHYRVLKANGAYVRLLEQNTVLHTDSQGNVTYVLGVCTDISGYMESAVPTASVHFKGNEPCLLNNSAADHLSLPEKLSNREKEVIRLIADGYSSKQIAGRLHISLHTVNTHRKKMIGKTNSKNSSGLVQFAIQHSII